MGSKITRRSADNAFSEASRPGTCRAHSRKPVATDDRQSRLSRQIRMLCTYRNTIRGMSMGRPSRTTLDGMGSPASTIDGPGLCSAWVLESVCSAALAGAGITGEPIGTDMM